MQSINVAVLNPWFLVAFFGTAAACVLALISALLQWHEPATVYLLVGSALYLIGTLLVTIVFNVPRNEILASVAPAVTNSASPVGRLRGQLDGLEPRSDGSGACRSGVLQRRTRLLSVAFATLARDRRSVAEMREQLGGYSLIDARDLDQAIGAEV